jgi:hypothetical protein
MNKEGGRRPTTTADRDGSQRRETPDDTCAGIVSQQVHREFVGLDLLVILRQLGCPSVGRIEFREKEGGGL